MNTFSLKMILALGMACIMATSEATVIHTDQISTLISSNPYVIIDFYIPRCSSCDFMGPIFERVSNMLQGTVTFVKVNAREAAWLGKAYNIRKVPTFLYFKNGNLLPNRHTGSNNPANGQPWNDQSFFEYIKSAFGL